MAHVNLRVEVPYYLREPPAASWNECDPGMSDYSEDERLHSFLTRYLKANGHFVKGRYCYSYKLDNDVEVFMFKLSGTNVRVKYYSFNEEADWPLAYPEKEVLEVRLSGDVNQTRINMFKRFGLEEIGEPASVLF